MNHYESLDDDTGALITLIGTEKGATMTICTDLGCVLHPQVVDVPFRVHGRTEILKPTVWELEGIFMISFAILRVQYLV